MLWRNLSLGVGLAALITACGNPLNGRSALRDNNEGPRAYAASDIMLAFDPASPRDTPVILVGVPEGVKDVYYCESTTATECSSSAQAYTRTQLLIKKGGRAIYRAQASLAARKDLTLAVTVLEANDQRSTRLVRIVPANDTAPPIASINLGDAPTTYLAIGKIASELQRWAQVEPRLMQYSKFADVNGQPASYLRVSKGVSDSSTARPKVLITAATHGDEKISTSTIIGFMHKFISGYGKDQAITKLIDTRDVYFVPVACPDGYATDSREVDGGVDPNRSYPSPVNPNRTPSRCVAELTKLFQAQKFNATIDYHAVGRLMMYPWSYTSSPIPDADYDKKYRAMAAKMAQSSGYRFGQIPTIIGYEAEGSSADYYHWQGNKAGFGTVAMAVEVGRFELGKAPDPRFIQPEIELNFQALMTFIDEAPSQFKTTSYAAAVEAPEAPAYEDFADLHAAGFLE